MAEEEKPVWEGIPGQGVSPGKVLKPSPEFEKAYADAVRRNTPPPTGRRSKRRRLYKEL